MRLRTFLLAVVGLTLVPLLGVAGIAFWWAHQNERRAMEQALLYQARSLTVAVDREVDTSLAGLKGLATSGDLDPADLRKFQFRRRDGRLIWVLVNVIRGSGPPRADFETTLVDITEQKAADELRSMARLANAAAHEINNPLTMVLGRLAMLQEDPSVSPEIRECIAQIHAAAERIREIVVDMNHLTRVQLFEHTGRGLPEMLDIRKSAGAPGEDGAPP